MSGKSEVASPFSALLPFAMSAGNEKKSQNLSTCRATPSQEIKLKKFIKLKGFRRPSDFWFRCMETFIEQSEATLNVPIHFLSRVGGRGGVPPRVSAAARGVGRSRVTKRTPFSLSERVN
jgi:hypothetical protein